MTVPNFVCKPLVVFLSFGLLWGCGGPSKGDVLEIPTDLPEICKGIDFVSQPDMRELCGVRVRNYRSYKNIPMQRYLINPKGSSIVKKDEDLELRLPNTLPIPLPSSLAQQISFTPEKRLEYIRNTMLYKELHPPGKERIKIFKLDLPLEAGGSYSLCFNLFDVEIDPRRRSHMGTRIEFMECSTFQQILRDHKE